MRVRCKKVGYYGHKLRAEGEVFDLEPVEDRFGEVIPVEKQFSKLWMEKVDKKAPVGEPKKSGKKIKNIESMYGPQEDDAQPMQDVI